MKKVAVVYRKTKWPMLAFAHHSSATVMRGEAASLSQFLFLSFLRLFWSLDYWEFCKCEGERRLTLSRCHNCPYLALAPLFPFPYLPVFSSEDEISFRGTAWPPCPSETGGFQALSCLNPNLPQNRIYFRWGWELWPGVGHFDFKKGRTLTLR